jgi:hypothetical protein
MQRKLKNIKFKITEYYFSVINLGRLSIEFWNRKLKYQNKFLNILFV